MVTMYIFFQCCVCSSTGPDAAAAKKAVLHQNNIAAAAVQESPMTAMANKDAAAADPFLPAHHSPSTRGAISGGGAIANCWILILCLGPYWDIRDIPGFRVKEELSCVFFRAEKALNLAIP